MILFAFLLIISGINANAYQTALTTSLQPLRWNSSVIPVQVINNSRSLVAAESLIDESINEWNILPQLAIQKVANSKNQIRFSRDFSIYGSAVIGVTELNYNANGVINTASILLNEQHFNFTATPALTDGYNIYLKDVVTHELGHFLGLAHSEVLNSSMFYSTFPGQSDLALDDISALRNTYGTGYGSISGSVKGGSHIGVLGAHVQAISRKTGQAIGAISDEDGNFTIGGLDVADTYYLYVSPLKNLSALPGHFANVQTEFCPGSFLGSFFTACGQEQDGFPQAISLTSESPVVNVGVVSVRCSLRTQSEYTYEKLQSNFRTINIFDFQQEQRSEKSFMGFFRKNELSASSFTSPDLLEVDLRGVSSPGTKKVMFKLISQPLGNLVEYHLKITRNNEIILDALKTPRIDGTFELDLGVESALSILNENNIYQIEIRARRLSFNDAQKSLPDPANFGEEDHLPYLFVSSLKVDNGLILDSGLELSDNQSCLDAPFTHAVAKADLNLEDKSSASVTGAAVASCGTMGPPGGGPGTGGSLLWTTLGFLLTLLLSPRSKRAKNFLS